MQTTAITWNEQDTARALHFWAEFQKQHDITQHLGETAGIDPVNGEVWFGDSAQDIWRQRQAEGLDRPVYCVRVGVDYYTRKGGRR